MDGDSNPPPIPQDNNDTSTVNGPDGEQGEGTSRQSAQDVPGREVTDNEDKKQEGPKKPEKKREEQGDKDNVALNEKEENKTRKEEGSEQGDEDNKNVEVTTDRADLTNENKTEQGDGNDVTPNENEDDETEEAADINREQQPAGGQGIPSTVTDPTLNTSSSSETLQSSTGGVGELDSSGEISSPGRKPFSSLPAGQTSTPIHKSGPGGNDDTASSEPSRQTSGSERSLKSRSLWFASKSPGKPFNPNAAENKDTSFLQRSAQGQGNANAGFAGSSATFTWPFVKTSDFSFSTPKDQSLNNSAQPFTHPRGTGSAGDEQTAPSQTVDQEEKAANASAVSPQDSGIGTSQSNSNHSAYPEQDHSLLRENIQKLETQNHQLRNQLEQQNNEVSRLTEDTNGLSDDRDRLNREKQEQTTELVAIYRERDNLAKQMTKLVGERDGLNAECNGLRADKADLESKNENLQQERADLQDQVSEREREGEEKDANIRELSTTISQNSEMVATADEKMRRFQDVDMRRQHAEQSRLSLQSKLKESTASVQQLEAELKKSNEGLGQEILQLQANLYRLTNERDELQTTSENQVSQLTGDMDALRTKCDSLNVWVEKLTDAKACLEGEKNDLEGKLRRTEKEKKNLIADHEVLEAQNNSSEAAMREIADRTRQLEELKENLEGQVADLQGEVKRKDEHTYGLSDTVARQCHALEGKERLEIEHQDVVTRLSDSQHQCATLQANVTDFTGRTQRLEAALAKEIEDHTREANALKVRVHELSNELGELQESSEREIASLAEVRSTLRSDCDRLNVRVDELENNKKRLEDKNRDLGERLKATERKAEELTTQKRVLERQKKTAEDQSVAYGQTSTLYQAQATQLQDLANAYRAQLETLTAQLRQRNESVLPLEMEARRARLEAQDTAAKLERTTKEKDLLVITVDALKAEVQLTALAIQDWHRKEADLRREIEKQVAQKNRYVKETQLARTQVKQLEEKVHQLELQEANRFRRGFPRLD